MILTQPPPAFLLDVTLFTVFFFWKLSLRNKTLNASLWNHSELVTTVTSHICPMVLSLYKVLYEGFNAMQTKTIERIKIITKPITFDIGLVVVLVTLRK